MRTFRIKEISGVDAPAQEGALALITKRRDRSMEKRTGREAFDRTQARVEALEQQRDRLQAELDAFNGAADGEQTIRQLEDEIAAMEIEVAQRRGEQGMDKSTTADAAAAIAKSAERMMDEFARGLQMDGETFEQAYKRASLTEFGKLLLINIDDAYRIEVGQPTSGELAKAAAERRRSTGGSAAEAEAEIEDMAKRRAAQTGVSLEKAYADVLATPEGGRLYAESIRA